MSDSASRLAPASLDPQAVHPPRALRAAWNWLDERLDLSGLLSFARHKEVPVGAHSMVWYYLGGVTMFFFLVQIATGILLLMYYQAGEATSYESMRYIVTKVPFGWLVRSVHCWSAHLMVLSLLLHMWSVFFLRAYRRPRELTWFTGIALFAVTLGFGFSGYLLPWNELSFFATAVGTDSVKSVPVIGEWLLRVLRGGDEVSIRTLYRFFALHVCLLPITTFAIVGVHIALIQKQGMAPPLTEPGERHEKRPGMPFFPNFALRDVLLWILALNVLALLAALLPHGPGIPGMEWALGAKADPLKPAYPGIKPEWYFLWMYQLLKEFPAHILGMEGPQACLALATVLLGIWALVPIVDRSAARGRSSVAFSDFGVGILYFLAFLMLKAWDVGSHAGPGVDPSADPASAAAIARTAAIVTLVLGAAVTGLRAAAWGHRYFWISGLVLLQAALHGFAGMSYLMAGGIAVALLVVVLAWTWKRGAAATLVVLMGLWLAPGARAEELPAARPAPAVAETGAGGSLAEASWPKAFRDLLDAKKDGQPIVPDKARQHFRELPSYAQEKFFQAQEKGFLDSGEQLAALLGLDISDENVELLVGDNCVLCHTNVNMQSEDTLFRLYPGPVDPSHHLDLRQVVSDVHMRRGLSCAGCHGGKPTDEDMSDEIFKRWPDREHRQADRSWIPGFCADRCHSVPGFMRRFNPSLPIDQLLKYRESQHGVVLLRQHDSKAAQCVSCHGVHGILRPSSPQSRVFPKNIPATCGGCHANAAYMRGYKLEDGKTPIPTNQLEQYKLSVHGRALFEKNDLGAPVCNDCHGNHAAMPPAVASVSQICRNCHVNNGKLFDGSPHKAAFERHGWPECEVCHGKHDIEKPSDAMLGTGPGSVCKDCHERYGKPICNQTAQYFHDELGRLQRERDGALTGLKAAEDTGLDLADVRFTLQAVDDSLVESRSKIHAFNRSEFDKATKKGFELIAEARQTTQATVSEYRERKVGLGISTLIVTIVAGLLYLKIRDIDRRSGRRGD
ncbi:MAG: cytochrome b N-terminal domain-containing protein [Acidobacteriota bacterium]